MWECQLKDKSKIEGAYLLLKRFKNRLKNLDNALERMDKKKVDHNVVENLAFHLNKDRAESVFDDMKILFDTTVKQFDEKLTYERNKI